MRRLLVLLALVVAVGAGAYAIYYHRAMSGVVVTPDGTDAELGWLKREFVLTPAQYEKVLALHHAYRPICADYCTRYIAVRKRLDGLLKNHATWSAEAGAAIAEQAKIQGECHASMLKYAYDVAACMSPEEGRRYLDMIKMQLMEGDPAGMFAAAR
ncbi:MAG: periplasmic heavy metal sensor [Verrucomicrobia bacterium]|nr:periplasmic heavy metal sensor [Verrucomicrobiota bacterium]